MADMLLELLGIIPRIRGEHSATMARCADAARDEGCNMYETYKAFEALCETSKQMLFGSTVDGRDK
jgi:hypothetical protein